MLNGNKVMSMSKFIKVMVSILLIGLVLTVGGYLAGGFRSFSIYNSKIIFNDEKNIVEKSYNISDVKKIKVDASNIDKIEIVTSSEFKLETKTYDLGDGNNTISYNVTDGVLSVKEQSLRNKINFSFMTNSHSNEKIKISIPNDVSLDDVNVVSSSSKVNISDVLLKNLSINCDYGNMDLKNINTEGDISIVGNSANIDFDNVSCNKLNANCDYGNINGKGVKVNNFNVNTDSGNIKLSSLNVSEMLSMNNKYGNIKINDGSINKLKIDADSGKVDISSNGLNTVDINNNYGNVDINTSEKDNLFNYKLYCKYGHVSINNVSQGDNYTREINASKNMNIKCDSGNIEINTGK